MYLVSEENLGAHCPHYIVRAIFDTDKDGEWEEDVCIVWVLHMPNELDAMHHTLKHGTASVYMHDNEHDAVDAWITASRKRRASMYDDSDTVYFDSFNLIKT